MELLKNQKDFVAWKKKHIHGEDSAEQPEEFPCFAELGVQSWNYEEQYAWYLYRSDVEKMLLEMPNVIYTPKMSYKPGK